MVCPCGFSHHWQYHDPVVRILAVSDEEDRSLTVPRLRDINPNIVVSCGDLGPDYLDFVSSAANAPLLYVPGNHDPDQRPVRGESEWTIRQPADNDLVTNVPRRPGGLNIDGKIRSDHELRFAGMGGSIRYRSGPNQYSQRQMKRRVNAMIRREWLRGFGSVQPVDVFIAHSPPLGVGDEDDPAHVGFGAFHKLISRLRPTYMLHGHIHPHGFPKPDRQIGKTTIINVIPHRVIEFL